MIPFLFPEALVVFIGLFLLISETFTPRIPKGFLAFVTVSCLSMLLISTFFWNFGHLQHSFELLNEGFYEKGSITETVLTTFITLSNQGFIQLDRTGLFIKQLVLLATILTILLSVDYSPVFSRYSSKPGSGLGEFYILPLFACAGMMWMATAKEFIMIFVSLELATITLYVLVTSMRRNAASLEAGAKYLILGALSTGFLVMGVAWIFGVTNLTMLAGISEQLPHLAPELAPALMLGLGLVLVALGFKIGAVPFQFWIPDTYQGAPTPVTAFLSVASKAAGFVVLLRVLLAFTVPCSPVAGKVMFVLTALTIATLVYGNLAALPQMNFKRLMAYSSVGHAGYLLMGAMAFLIGPNHDKALDALKYYFAAYLVMTFVAFAVMGLVYRAVGSDDIAAYNGLGKRSPFLALMLLVALASLAGVPFTMGFLAKFFVFAAAFDAGLYGLVVVGVGAVACGFYYYFKVVRAMYWEVSSDDAVPVVVPQVSRVVLVLLTFATITFGVYPGWPKTLAEAFKAAPNQVESSVSLVESPAPPQSKTASL